MTMKELRKEELTQLVSDKKEFILELSKEECPYCKMINEKETDVITFNHLSKYKYILPADNSESDIFELNQYLDPLKYVPCFYHMKDGKVVSYLIIQDWRKPEDELKIWMNKQ